MSGSGRLIVLAAFDKDDEGNLAPAFEPRQIDTEEQAKREAQMMMGNHAGVVAWSRHADPALGEYGPPTILFQAGETLTIESVAV